MNDPHVVFLTYRLKPCSDLKFDNPPAGQHDNDVLDRTQSGAMRELPPIRVYRGEAGVIGLA